MSVLHTSAPRFCGRAAKRHPWPGSLKTCGSSHSQEFFNYLGDGNCSISNSLAENCIRPFVIGRKNWLFAGSPKGAAASAGIYTLVETAKANGLDAMKYIKYILADMPGSRFLENPEYLDDYLPWDPMVQERCR